jgi:uncharacterized protein (DUF433 family)
MPPAEGAAMSQGAAYMADISIDPEVCGGKPCLRGTRITVAQVLEMLGDGMPESEILLDYPHISPQKIRAAAQYAAERCVAPDSRSVARSARSQSYREWIATDPKVLAGRPHIRGTQLSVQSVLARLGDGASIDQIAADTQALTLPAVQAALLYASTHVPFARRS